MMNKKTTFLLGWFLVFFTGSLLADDDYDPANPAEPYTYYQLTVKAQPAGYAYGSGKYMSGTQVSIRTSAQTNYTFSHWEKDGEFYSDAMSFTFVMPEDKVELIAVYDYDPIDPAEPLPNYTHRLFLSNNITEACSFNLSSGTKVKEDTYVRVCAYGNRGYDFVGWFENGTLISEVADFNYLMGTSNVYLEAKYVYNPVNPDEPVGSPDADVANASVGDLDEDGKVDIVDKVILVNHYLEGTTSELNPRLGDVNQDGSIDIVDAVEIVNIYLNNK